MSGVGGGSMDAYISVAASTLDRVFSGDREFQLPWIQRAYAWQIEHVGRLLSDVREAMHGERKRYFLGHLHLAQKTGDAQAALIDGQQRAISLTILFALLRDLLPSDRVAARAELDGLLWKAGSAGRQPRLALQPNVAEFFASYILADRGTLQEPEEDVMSLPIPARNMLENRNYLRSALEAREMSADERDALAAFLRTSCWVITESVEDQEEAWAMLATEEDTGLGFHCSEEAKITLVSVMPHEEQEEAARIWEKETADLPPDDVSALLAQIRALEVGGRSKRPVEKDLIERFDLNHSGKAFIEKVFVPRVIRYHLLRKCVIDDGPEARKLGSLETLWWIQHQMWIAPALGWLDRKRVDRDETARFFAQLDRLAWFMRLAGIDPTEQETRFCKLSKAARSARTLGSLELLEIDAKLVNRTLETLRSRTFYSKHTSGMVMRRLSRLMGQNHGPTDGSNVTIEHVLPRNPAERGSWSKHFRTREEANRNFNRLGNLALLPHKENIKVGNLDYADKREIMRKSSFALTVAAANRFDEWSEHTIDVRTEEMIGLLFEAWQVPVR